MAAGAERGVESGLNVLGVFAHPDDEVLGAGGTLAKHAAAEDEVGICWGTDVRRSERMAASKILGLSTTNRANLGLPDQKFETTPISWAISFLTQWSYDPDVIYTHHPGDLNLDHAWLARAVLTAFRPKPGEKPRTILACEVLSSTEWTFPQVFAPNWFEALGFKDVQCKVKALECYSTEIRDSPHPRSADGIFNAAGFRGQQCGVAWAEAFQLLRRGPC